MGKFTTCHLWMLSWGLLQIGGSFTSANHVQSQLKDDQSHEVIHQGHRSKHYNVEKNDSLENQLLDLRVLANEELGDNIATPIGTQRPRAGQPEFTSEDQEEELTEVRPLDLLDLDSIEFHGVMTEATLPSSSQVPGKSHRTQLDDEEDQNVEDDERDEENDSVDEEEEYLETTIQTSRKNAEGTPLKRDSSSSIVEQTTRGSVPSRFVTYERIPTLQEVEDGGSGGVEGGGMTTPIPDDADGAMSPGEVTPALSTMSRETSEIGRGLAELLSGPWAHNESQEADLSTDNIEEILKVDKKSNVPQKLVDAVDPRADEDLLELMVRIAESPNEWRHVHETLQALDHDLATSSGHLSELNRVQKTAKKNDDESTKYNSSLHSADKEHRKHKTVEEENKRKKQKHKERSKSKEKTSDERRREELERAGVLPPTGKTSKYRDGSSKQGTNNDIGLPRPTTHSPKANDIREWLASGSKPDKSKTDNVWYKSDSLPAKNKVGDRGAYSGSHWVKNSNEKSSYQLSTQLPKGVTWTKTKTNDENKLSKETIRNRLIKPPKNEVTARMKDKSNTTNKEENHNFMPSTTPTKMKGKHRLKHKLKHILASSQKYKAERPPPQFKTASLDSAISYLSNTKPVVDYEDARRHGKLIYSKGLPGNGNRPKMSASVDEGRQHGTIVFSKDGTRNDNWPEMVNNRNNAIGRPVERWQQSLKTLKNKNWGRAPSPVKSDSAKSLETPTMTTFSEKVARKYPKNPVVTKNTFTWPRVADDAGQYVTYDQWPEFSLESLKHGNLLEHHKPWPVSPENQNSDPDTNRVTNFWPNLAMDLSPSYINDRATESKGWPNLNMGDGRSNHIDPAGDNKPWAKSLSMEDTRAVPSNPWPQETREKPMSALDSAIARHSSATAGAKDTNTTNRQWPHFTYHRVTSSPQMLAAAQRARHRNAYIAVSVVPPQGASKNKSQVIVTGGGPSEIKVNSTSGGQPQRAPLPDKMDELLAERRDPLEEELIDVAAGVKSDSNFQEIPWSHARHLDKIQEQLKSLSAMEEKLRYHWLEKERLHQILRDGGKSRSGFYRSVRDSSTPHPFTTTTTTILQ